MFKKSEIHLFVKSNFFYRNYEDLLDLFKANGVKLAWIDNGNWCELICKATRRQEAFVQGAMAFMN